MCCITWLFNPIGASMATQFAIKYRAGRAGPDPAGSEWPSAGEEMMVSNRDICNCREAWVQLPPGAGGFPRSVRPDGADSTEMSQQEADGRHWHPTRGDQKMSPGSTEKFRRRTVGLGLIVVFCAFYGVTPAGADHGTVRGADDGLSHHRAKRKRRNRAPGSP